MKRPVKAAVVDRMYVVVAAGAWSAAGRGTRREISLICAGWSGDVPHDRDASGATAD